VPRGCSYSVLTFPIRNLPHAGAEKANLSGDAGILELLIVSGAIDCDRAWPRFTVKRRKHTSPGLIGNI
jgi:hypothetical protein